MNNLTSECNRTAINYLNSQNLAIFNIEKVFKKS